MLSPASPSKKCTICVRPAFGKNYGSLSCDACKMFFRRCLLLDLQFNCRRSKRCFENLTENSKTPHCKFCRFQKCLETGMFIKPSAILTNDCKTDNTLDKIIGQLLYLDSRRTTILMSKFSFENPGLTDIIEKKKIGIVTQTPTYQLTDEDWRFFGMYTTVDFLLNLDFMEKLDVEDKITLLKSFAAKATMLFTSLKTMRGKNEKLVTPGGHEIVPDALSEFFDVSLEFLRQIRSLLVNKFIELNITNEELLLVTVILFCDPAISTLSENCAAIVTSKRGAYTSALFQYCQLIYQATGHTRFLDLLSICHVVNKNMEDIQNLTIIVKMKLQLAECKQLFNDII
ncbi:Protein CBR-NHR-222 [Caenorhabditis briggsae]|uniref:Protein CBR-NHR-222 n=1 Tax=Caenorhabditis briggsae TaxID=6238 RepID=A8WQ66_CAEBR|nr:Protein CBR-NHR-222 [Caenorhabditis briggsae]CAP22624.2 Protein CBR-NHR-222 [Caenorhabditis briggsae]